MTKKKAKRWTVVVPITGSIVVSVEADNEEAAIDAALSSEQLTLKNVDEWEAHRQICEGNVLYAAINEATAEEES